MKITTIFQWKELSLVRYDLEKVFLSGDLKLRVLANYHDIKYLAELERYIIESLESGLASTDKKITSLIDNFIPSSMKTIKI